MFKQFDIVQIITTKGIKYLSGPPGHTATPHHNWSIVGFVGSEAVLARESTLVRVPLTDIRKIGDFSITNLLQKMSSAGYFKKQTISMSEHISKTLNITIAEARQFLIDYNFKLDVETEADRDNLTERVKILWQRRKI